MKKISKSLILLGAMTAIIGGTAILQTETLINKINQKQEIQAYNHNPSNILDNIFVENNTTYLPFIFTDATETISVDKIKSEFTKVGLTVKNISTTKIGTGTKITVTQNSKVYNVLVYGDTNGDGNVNLIDAQKIILHKKNPTKNALAGIYFKAGNVSNNNTTVDLIDAQRVIMFKKGTLSKLVVIEPTSLKELDSVKPVIDLGSNGSTMQITVGEQYRETVKATDNYDGDITNKIVKTIKFNGTTVSSVDTSKLGTYVITYNVKDNALNTADTKTRTVTVGNAITDIKITKNPTKTTYNYGETVDYTGIAVQVIMKVGSPQDITNLATISTDTFSTSGKKNIYVEYNGFQKTFKEIFTVLDEITTLKFTADSNITAEGGVYNISNEEINLGIIEAEGSNVSKLKAEQLQIDSVNNLTITKEQNGEGKVLLKAKALASGNYTIKAYVKSDQTYEIKLKAVEKLANISLEPIGEELKTNLTNLSKALTITNNYGETIDIPASELTIEISDTIKSSITITKLNSVQKEINDETTIVKYIGIKTNGAEATGTIKLSVTRGEENISTGDITLTIVGESIVNNVKIQEKNTTQIDESILISTGIQDLDIYFYNQEGNQMDIETSNIKLVSKSKSNSIELTKGQVAILVPDAITGAALLDSSGIIVLNRDEEIKSGAEGKYVKGIQFIVDKNLADLSSLENETITIKWNDGNATTPVSKDIKIVAKYNAITQYGLSITDTGRTDNVDVNPDLPTSFEITSPELGFTLGTIVSGKNEQPLTNDMININSKNGLDIQLVEGTTLIQGTGTGVELDKKYEVEISVKNTNPEEEPISITIYIFIPDPNS